MIITIGGTPGSGKSTVAKLLAEKLGYERYYMGGLKRQMAAEKGITLNDLTKLEEKDAFTDQEVDEYQRRLGQTKDNFVIEGRTSFHFIPHSLKVFIAVDPAEGARRIYEQVKAEGSKERNEKVGASVAETQRLVLERRDGDAKRYQQYYGFDYLDANHYDLVLDSTHQAPEALVAAIVAKVQIP